MSACVPRGCRPSPLHDRSRDRRRRHRSRLSPANRKRLSLSACLRRHLSIAGLANAAAPSSPRGTSPRRQRWLRRPGPAGRKHRPVGSHAAAVPRPQTRLARDRHRHRRLRGRCRRRRERQRAFPTPVHRCTEGARAPLSKQHHWRGKTKREPPPPPRGPPFERTHRRHPPPTIRSPPLAPTPYPVPHHQRDRRSNRSPFPHSTAATTTITATPPPPCSISAAVPLHATSVPQHFRGGRPPPHTPLAEPAAGPTAAAAAASHTSPRSRATEHTTRLPLQTRRETENRRLATKKTTRRRRRNRSAGGATVAIACVTLIRATRQTAADQCRPHTRAAGQPPSATRPRLGHADANGSAPFTAAVCPHGPQPGSAPIASACAATAHPAGHPPARWSAQASPCVARGNWDDGETLATAGKRGGVHCATLDARTKHPTRWVHR